MVDLLSAAWAKRKVVIGLWSAVNAESFKNLPMKDCAMKKMSSPRTLAFIPNIIFPSFPGFVPIVIKSSLANRKFWLSHKRKDAQANHK